MRNKYINADVAFNEAFKRFPQISPREFSEFFQDLPAANVIEVPDAYWILDERYYGKRFDGEYITKRFWVSK